MAPEHWHLMQPNWPSDRAASTADAPARGRARVKVLDRLAVLAVGARRRPGPGARARPRAAHARRRRPHHRALRRPAARARHHLVGPSVAVRRATARSRRSPQAQKLASERTLEALRSFRPDVVHLHEPLVPGPTDAALLGADVAAGRHVPRRGEDGTPGWYSTLQKVAAEPLVRQLDDPHRGVGRRAAHGARTRSAAYEIVLPNGVDLDAVREGRAVADGAARPILFLGRHEPRKGLGVLLDAFAGLDRDAVLWVASDGPETEALRDRAHPGRRVARPHHRRTRRRRRLEARRVLRARARAGVVRHRAARGDGRGHGGRRVRHRRLPRTSPAPDREALLVPPRRRRGAARRRCAACSTTRRAAAELVAAGSSGRRSSRCAPRRAVHPASTRPRSRSAGHRTVSPAVTEPARAGGRGRGATSRTRSRRSSGTAEPADGSATRPAAMPRSRSTRSRRRSCGSALAGRGRHRLLLRGPGTRRATASRGRSSSSTRSTGPGPRPRARVVLRLDRGGATERGRDARRRLVRRRARAEDRAALLRRARRRRPGARPRPADADRARARRRTPTSARCSWTAGLRGRPLAADERRARGAGRPRPACAAATSTSARRRSTSPASSPASSTPTSTSGRRIVDEFPETEPAFLAVGEGIVCTNFPYDVAAADADRRRRPAVWSPTPTGARSHDHPAVGSCRGRGPGGAGGGDAPSCTRLLLDAVDRGNRAPRDRGTPSTSTDPGVAPGLRWTEAPAGSPP